MKKKDKKRITGEETDNHERGSTMGDADIPLENGTICLCLAPAYPIGSEIEKRKNAQARLENKKSSTHQPDVPLKSPLPTTQQTVQYKPPLVHHISNGKCSKALRQPDSAPHQFDSVWHVPDIYGCTDIQEATS